MTEETNTENLEMPDEADTNKPKMSKPKQSTRKPKPKRDFPLYSIEESKKVVEAIKNLNAGNPWAPREALIKSLSMG